MTPAWPDEDDGLLDHHPPCPCGKELADECRGPGNGCPLARPNPLGAFQIEAPIGSTTRWSDPRSDPVADMRAMATGQPVAPLKPWQPGDPCGSCGSTNTAWSSDPTDGAVCRGCGATDADE